MAEYIYPLATLVLDFFCLILCIRYALARRGLVWLVPTLLSLILLLGSIICLLATASNIAGPTLSDMASYLSIFLFTISAVWIIVIIAFGQRMKPKMNEAAIYEAEFLSRNLKEVPQNQADSRPTAASKISKTKRLDGSVVLDLYDKGPVRTLRPKRTAR